MTRSGHSNNVKVLINVPARDLSAVWERSSTNFVNFLKLSVLERADLILLTMLIHIKHQTKSVWPFLSFIISFLFIATSIINSSKFLNIKNHIKSNTPIWNWTCLLQSEKLNPFNIRTYIACEHKDTGTNIAINTHLSLNKHYMLLMFSFGWYINTQNIMML